MFIVVFIKCPPFCFIAVLSFLFVSAMSLREDNISNKVIHLRNSKFRWDIKKAAIADSLFSYFYIPFYFHMRNINFAILKPILRLAAFSSSITSGSMPLRIF